MNPSLSLDKSFNCEMRIIERMSFKLTILKELMTENLLRQNLAQKRVPSLVVRPLTLRTSTLVLRVAVGESWPLPGQGYRS